MSKKAWKASATYLQFDVIVSPEEERYRKPLDARAVDSPMHGGPEDVVYMAQEQRSES